MHGDMPTSIAIAHNKVPNRIRLRTACIKNQPAIADLLKLRLLKRPEAKGIYHAEPNIVTGTLLIKYHPAHHTEAGVLALVEDSIREIAEGKIKLPEKSKSQKIGKMSPAAFFTRELFVDIFGNLIAGIVVAAIISA